MPNDPPAIRSSMWFSCCNLVPPSLARSSPSSFTRFPTPFLACNLSFSHPPFSVVVFQHPQPALRDVVRLESRAVLGRVAKLHGQMGRIDHLRIGRANGDYVIPE